MKHLLPKSGGVFTPCFITNTIVSNQKSVSTNVPTPFNVRSLQYSTSWETGAECLWREK